MTSNHGYSSYSSSSSAGGAGGGVNAEGLFSQVDANKDGTIDRNEFSNFLSNSLAGRQAAVGGAGAVYGSSSCESSSYPTAGDALGGAAAFESSAGGAFDASAVSPAAGYTAETNAAWSQYGADVRGPGLYVDSNPQIIRRQVPGGVQTYTQNIKIRFLQPPPIPPPGPLIIKEVRSPQPPPLPPLRIKQQAPPLPQLPPLILREKPPSPPTSMASQTVIRRLPALPVPPRSVIVERLPAAPARPRDIIIERWIPYGASAQRKTIVQRAEAAAAYPAPRNVIIQYEAAQVCIVRRFERLGITPENPQAYVQRHGAQLLDATTLLQQARAAGVVEDISPPAGAAVTASSSSFNHEASFGSSGAVLGDLAGVASDVSYSSSNFETSAVDGVGAVEGGLSGSGFESGVVGGASFGEVAGAGAEFNSSNYRSSSFSRTGGAVGGSSGGYDVGGTTGFDVAGAVFNMVDTNKDGRLDASEFKNFVQGAL